MKTYRLRNVARVDVTAAFDYFFGIEEHLAEQFQADLEASISHIQMNPGTGSPRYSKLWPRSGRVSKLRFWLLTQFPYSIFYVEHEDWIDVVRVLHQASDIPQHLKNK
jgi:toxin ParE1/3/4